MTRQAGDALEKELIRSLRDRSGLSQDAFAERLGVRGGKGVISGWENGHAKCEGPAAELALLLFAGGTTDTDFDMLDAKMERTWSRGGADHRVSPWRQILMVVDDRTEIETKQFVQLFPKASIPDGRHGFPFTQGLGDVFGVSPTAWLGAIPNDEKEAPSYAWTVTREGHFVSREHIWEDDPLGHTEGNIDVASVLFLAVRAAVFYGQLLVTLKRKADVAVSIRLDIEGTTGRKLVDVATYPSLSQGSKWSENRASARINTTRARLSDDPKQVAFDLVTELAAFANPKFATDATLEAIVKRPAIAHVLEAQKK